MDFLSVFLLVSSLLWTCLFLLTNSGYRKKPSRLPPGPRPYPIIGNILAMGEKPHHTLSNLAKTYGPLMTLKLGSITTVVVSSPEMAKNVLQKNDHVLSSRHVPGAAQALDHQKVSIVWLPVNTQWRTLRRICKENIFSSQRLDASQELRGDKLRKLLDYVSQCSISGQAVNIGEAAFTTSLNLISATLFSYDHAAYNSESAHELKDLIRHMMECGGAPNLADYFPVFQFADPQGIKKQVKFYFEKIFVIFDRIIDERLQARRTSPDFERKSDLLEILLDLHQKSPPELTRADIKHLLLDLFVAGTDTSSNTTEWAIAELLHNPEKMSKLKAEIRDVIGQNGKIQESDIPRLPYLQAVIRETFRVHPAIPFLLPHKAEEDVEINGYIIPKNSQILVNVWSFGRDPSVWSDPETFMPERFLGSDMDVKGKDFELIPFGAGRRMCPGMPLAYRMVPQMVVSLVHHFDWKLENGIEHHEMDMSDKFGLTVQKAEPVRAIPVKSSAF